MDLTGEPGVTLTAEQKAYLPMTETAYYTLLSLLEPRHGYGIMQHVEGITAKRLSIGAGTLYGSLARMERDGVIVVLSEQDRRKTYAITAAGSSLLALELARLRELVANGAELVDEAARTEALA